MANPTQLTHSEQQTLIKALEHIGKAHKCLTKVYKKEKRLAQYIDKLSNMHLNIQLEYL